MISHVNLKQPPQTHRNRGQICGFQRQGGGRRNPRKVVKRVQTSIYKINKYLGGNVQHDIYS